VNLGSTWGQPGVNLGSTWGQPGVTLNRPTVTAEADSSAETAAVTAADQDADIRLRPDNLAASPYTVEYQGVAAQVEIVSRS